MKRLCLCLLIICCFHSIAHGIEGIYTVVIKKQEEKQREKQSSRWTLADWLITKKKIALMDQWLALNTSKTWFEFKFSGATGAIERADQSPVVEADAKSLGASMFVRMIGFEYEKVSVDGNSHGIRDQESYQASLLIIGSSIQSTSLIGHYGQRRTSWQDQGQFKQDFYGGRLTLYLAPFLGVTGRYDYYPETASDNITTNQLRAERVLLSPFIEWGALRLKADFATEKRRLFSSGQFSQAAEEKSGLFGLELYL